MKNKLKGLKPGDCISRYDSKVSECKVCMITADCRSKTLERRKTEKESAENEIRKEEQQEKKQEASSELVCEQCGREFKTPASLRAHKAHCGGKRKNKLSPEDKAKEKAHNYLIDKLCKRFDKFEMEESDGNLKYDFLQGSVRKCVLMILMPEKQLKIVVSSGDFTHKPLTNMEEAKSLAKKILSGCGVKFRGRKTS